jgi:hypothetical protein
MTHHNGWQRTSKLLSPHDKQGDQDSYGTFQSFEHKRLLFTAGHWFPISSIVSLEYNDVLFVGEVLVCTRESDHSWTVLVQVQHLLNGLQSLLHWREQLLGVPSSTVTTSSHFANSPVAA